MKGENGLIYPDGSFLDKDELMRKAALANDEVQFLTPIDLGGKDFDYWIDRFIDRQVTYQETEDSPTNHVEIRLPRESCIAFIGDTHLGSPNTNYKRLKKEIYKIVETPDTYVMLMGDLIDAFFWNPAQMEQIEQVPEQIKIMRSVVDFLSDHKKLLVGWSGDHDGWAKRMGTNVQTGFSQRTGAYYLQGMGFVSLYIGEQEYKITGAHRLPGHSMYNKVHGQLRAEKFGGARNSDLIISGHTHKKGIAIDGIAEFGGKTRQVTYMSIGPYKSEDDYSKKMGWAKQTADQMFGTAAIFSKEEHHIDSHYDIIRACKAMK